MTKQPRRVVIVGAGQAALSCLTALRRAGFDGTITLIGNEDTPPYERPPLSKKVLTGAQAGEDLHLITTQGLADLDIDCMRAEVCTIDRDAKCIVTDDGTRVSYDELVLATGSRARPLPASIPGAQAAGVYMVRTIADSEAIAGHLPQARSCVVIGGGFIGVEVAAALAVHGVTITLLEFAEHLLARVAPAELGHWVEDKLTKLGVTVKTGTSAIEITRTQDAVSAVRDSHGDEHPADIVIAGIGGMPNSELAEAAGLEVDGGVVVNEFLATSDPHIHAIGDCAIERQHDGTFYRCESVQAAQDQGRHLGQSLAGKISTPFSEVPWFWSDIGTDKIQMAGRIDLATTIVTRGDVTSDSFSLFGYREDTFVGSASVNRTFDYMAARMFLAKGHNLDHTLAEDESVDLRAEARKLPKGR